MRHLARLRCCHPQWAYPNALVFTDAINTRNFKVGYQLCAIFRAPRTRHSQHKHLHTYLGNVNEYQIPWFMSLVEMMRLVQLDLIMYPFYVGSVASLPQITATAVECKPDQEA